jgi:glycosyltransferase involved in cell wall biosynthesis
VSTINLLHLQSGPGTRGGIANYILSLITSPGLKFKYFVSIPAENLINNNSFLNHSEVCNLPETYNFFNFIFYILELRKIVVLNNIRIIHAHALRSAFACAILNLVLNINFVYTNHGIRYTQKKSPYSRLIFFLLEIFVCFYAKKIICIRHYDYQILTKFNFLFNPTKLFLVKTQIALRRNSQEKIARKRNFILGIGSLNIIKRPALFCEWASELIKYSPTPFKAFWLGDGVLLDSLKDKSKKNFPAINFIGHVEKKDIFLFLENTKFLFLTSSFETFPYVVLEAYSMGVPVVSSRIDGIDDFVLDMQTGVILDSNNPKDIVNKLLPILSNHILYKQLSKNARNFYELNHSKLYLMRRQYQNLYSTVIV